MKCPYCGNVEDKVVDSRLSAENISVRRRRECLKCGRRFTTYEHIEELPLMVIKKDGRRQPFDRKKILSGMIKACEKRPISIEKLESLVDNIERLIQRKFEKEVKASEIGELVVKELHDLDDVAYVRFASVYRQFRDINEFMRELKELLNREENQKH